MCGVIKLVASDLDGTLLQDGKKDVSDEAITWIRRLKEQGILFAAASGRQYESLRKLFEPVKDEIAYIADNGACVVYQGEVLYKNCIDRGIGKEILQAILDRDGCEIALSGIKTLYLQAKSPEYVEYAKTVMKNTVTSVDDILSVEEPYIKISIYEPEGVQHSEGYFQDMFGDKVTVVTSGNFWMDIVAKGVNKGAAMVMLQKKLGVKPSECMAFGDHYNDVELLQSVGFPYAMDNARPEIYEMCKYHTKRVETVLQSLVEGTWDL